MKDHHGKKSEVSICHVDNLVLRAEKLRVELNKKGEYPFPFFVQVGEKVIGAKNLRALRSIIKVVEKTEIGNCTKACVYVNSANSITVSFEI